MFPLTVYAAHELSTKTDISSAAVYGDIRYVNHRYIYADEIKGDRPPKGFDENIRKTMEGFNPKKDYLLIAGDHLQIVMLVHALAEMFAGFYVLRYEREAKGYIPVMIGTVE